MSIKAKAVDKGKAAAFARGHFGPASAAAPGSAGKRSYFHEGERRYAEAEAADSSGSSSSSANASRGTSPAHVGQPPRQAGAARRPQQAGSGSGSDSETSDDEEVVRRARAATQALLGGSRPASATAAAPATASPPSTRLEAYLRSRTCSAPSLRPSELAAATRIPGGAGYASSRTEAPPTNGHHNGGALSAGVVDAAPAVVTLPRAVDEALQWHTTNEEFQQLMGLLAQDVQQEHGRSAAVALVSAAESTRQARRQAEGASASSSASAAPAAPSRTYAPPSRTFAALEDTTLQQLYEDWCVQRGGDAVGADGTAAGGDDEEADGAAHPPEVFVAAEHRAAAFAMAAASAAQQPLTSAPRAATAAPALTDAPFSWEELLQSSVTRRNARYGHGGSSGGGGGGDTLLSDPAALANQATRRLQRFLQSVECVERLVRDRRFMHGVAVFLYEHHRVFLPHYRAAATPQKGDAAAGAAGVEEEDGAAPTLVEHTHAEHRVYEEFGERVSAALLSVLTRYVPGFDEAEFVEALYDTPAADVASLDEAWLEAAAMVAGPRSVLTFPAWRLLLAMSGFESFFAWMMDYVYEEYHLDRGGEGDSPKIAVVGARGLRALIRSTYNTRPGDAVPAATAAADAPPSAPAADGLRREKEASLLLTSAASDASATVAPVLRPSSEPQHASTQPPSASLRVAQTPPPPQLLGLPGRPAMAAAAPGGSAPVRKFFPTPPASAEGSHRSLTGPAVPPYRKRQTTHPGRDLPPIDPSTNSLMLSTSTVADAASPSPLSSVNAPNSVVSDAGALAPGRAARDKAPVDGSARQRSKSRSSSNRRAKPPTMAPAAAVSAPKPKPPKPRLNR